MEIYTGITDKHLHAPDAAPLLALERSDQRNHKQSLVAAETSIFFRLPPEIRNIIYHQVLGGHHFHVYADDQAPCTPIEPETKGKKDAGAKIHLYQCNVHEHDPSREWLDEHLGCYGSASQGLPDIQLLLVSRQIYEEAIMIPLAANTFTFISPASFEKFTTEALTHRQTQSLRSIALWSSVAASSILDIGVSWKHWLMPKTIRDCDLLVGLQYLTVNISIYDEASLHDFDAIQGILSFGNTASRHLKRVVIVMTYDDGSRGPDEAKLDHTAVNDYSQKLKRALLENRRCTAVC